MRQRRAVPRGTRDRGRAGPAPRVERGKRLSELSDDELAELVPQLDGTLRDLLEPGTWLESKVSEGGTLLARVRDQLAQARHVLADAAD